MTTVPTPAALATPTRPRVLFVGHDASSPQIAASLLRRVVGDRVAVEIAGTQTAEPGGRSDEMLVAMGLDPADEHRLSTRALHTADRVVILGAEVDVARLPGPRYEQWDLAQDDLVDRVEALGAELTAVAVPATRRPSVLERVRTLLGNARAADRRTG